METQPGVAGSAHRWVDLQPLHPARVLSSARGMRASLQGRAGPLYQVRTGSSPGRATLRPWRSLDVALF